VSRPIKILVVEDSEDDARLALRALRRGGYEPEHRRVQDITGLLQAFENERWEAVISDFSMPGFTGIDALNAFRTTGLDIPFIFVSGTIGEETAVMAMKAGASDYVMKQNLARLAPALDRELAQAAVRAERRQAEVDLRRFEAQLRHAQQMESIGTLAGGIAHDFNNILGAILGHATLLREELGTSHKSVESVDEIQKAGLRARELVRQILAFSRKQPQRLKPQALAPIIDETYRLLRATLPSGVSLEADNRSPLLHARTDATQIQQVLMNLCTNAWHAVPDDGGRIVLGLETAQLDPRHPHRPDLVDLPDGPYAHLWVSDNGTGMDAATRARIFEPFFTTKPVGQGTGLGLAVVHGIVMGHGGGIHVESAPHQGSAFHLYLPACDAPEASEVPTVPVPTARQGGRGEHVVYIDDDETMTLVVGRLLQRAGYRVSTYGDAQVALRAIQAQPEGIDLVLTDFNMPNCSGLQVAWAVARMAPTLPVVISSGHITDELRARALTVGVRELLEKENLFEALCPLVARLLGDAPAG
jgi:signal transduction histidine kinase